VIYFPKTTLAEITSVAKLESGFSKSSNGELIQQIQAEERQLPPIREKFPKVLL
jgi:hypothetical protein